MKNIVIFTDCGDTLVDESQQVFEGDKGLVRSAELIPGADDTLWQLHRAGYRIALVADGLIQSFANITAQHGLDPCFDAKAISEEFGVSKPDPIMFRTAMERMGLEADDVNRIIMVGNNLERDIVGANRMGICSVLLTYSPRYRMEAETPEEEPDYRIAMPAELLGLVSRLEEKYAQTGKIKP